MSFLDILYKILIGPLQLVFEIIFTIANRVIGHPGFTIIVLSLIMNFLVLPLYRRADMLQEQERDVQAKLQRGVAHIKKTFSGDERMMMLQTYYRQNNYKPTDALHGSISLLLEIPFFIAAYQFLSHLQILQGVSLGPIRDLGAPDALLLMGGLTINILPILMTAINVVSSAIYLKGFPLKSKIQLYAIAVVFLVFLYNSPAGLVFYWTLNNIFSLVKNIFCKMKNSRKVLGIIFSATGIFLIGFTLFVYGNPSLKRRVFLIGIGILFELPMLSVLLKNRINLDLFRKQNQPNQNIFVLGSLFLTILTGLLIPSNVIAASPQEFVDLTYFQHPLWYLVSATCLAGGTFLIWMRVFYWLASDNAKAIFDRIVWILCGVMIVNYMFFGTDLGLLSANLTYETGLRFTLKQQFVNIIVLAILSIIMYLLCNKYIKVLGTVLLIATIATTGMSGLNIITINKEIANLDDSNYSKNIPHFNLSTEGNNVIVFMLDRAMGEYIPYIMNEKPELKEQFSGFTYYSNTISFGSCTNLATPALFGGYEYVPVKLNIRKNELLVDKHNEALKVMPVIFDAQGYEVTVCDIPYANYQWVPDLSIYNDYPNIQTYITKGKFNSGVSPEKLVEINHRNFFCFSMMKTLPFFVQPTIYNEGVYNNGNELSESVQIAQNNYIASGKSHSFMKEYSVLENLSTMTKVIKGSNDTFLIIENSITHEPMLLQAPFYTPSPSVDNTEYESMHGNRFELNNTVLKMETTEQMSHYHANMAALMKLGDWFDYMRENDVYDNTRIILVADHGRGLRHLNEFSLEKGSAESYFPLLMVKDFNATEFHISTEFMTNADVATLATNGIIHNPTNPFTGNEINSNAKLDSVQYIITSGEWDTSKNNGTTFLPSTWYAVKDDIWNKDNWRFIDEVTTMPSELLED